MPHVLSREAWTPIKVASLKVDVDRTSTHVLPCRDDDSYGALHAHIQWLPPSGKGETTGSVFAHEIAYDVRKGVGGVLSHHYQNVPIRA